ncbi:MAG TPA: glycosyltransferase [Verrucomicrobiae bacterium]|jgi:glycosyltransferase involved in cell wall biosynthesis|nr:glycosyltransferase [Verrucomicrobiae bacterium]
MAKPAANNLRILHLNTLLTGGGTDDQCVKLAYGLKQLGENVSIAGPDGRDFSRVIRNLEIPFHVTPPEGWLKLRYISYTAKLIRREKINIVHGHHGRDIWPTLLAAQLSGAKPKIILSRHLAKSPRSWLSRVLLLRQCDALIAVSEFTARVLRDGFYEPASPEKERHSRPPVFGNHSKVHVVHGGIDTARFRPFDAEAQRREWGLQPGDYAFAVAGGYDLPRGKGQREFLQAAARIHAQVPAARFLIIGRGSMGDTLRADIERLGLAGKAWLTPYCQDMPKAMNAIDCLVHPQIGTEAFGLVLLEAFACGKPVIASALDGIPEAFEVGNFGQLVQPESVEELGAAMLKWASTPALTAAQKNALHEKVTKDYSVIALAERMQKLYAELLPA